MPGLLIARDALIRRRAPGIEGLFAGDAAAPAAIRTREPRALRAAGWTGWCSVGDPLLSVGSDSRTPPLLAASVQVRPQGLCVRPDALALGPLFVLRGPRGVEAVGSDPGVLAALGDGALDPLALFEDVSFGFRIARRTAYSGVERLLPGERVEIDDPSDGGEAVASVVAGVVDGPNAGDARIPDTGDPAPGPPTGRLSAEVAEAFAAGNALELTGGIDSRLVLALGLARGARPSLAFTIGGDASEDVSLAREICREFGIRHHAVEVPIDPAGIVGDASDFAERSGFAANSASYAWLPGVFRALAPLRDGQIGGAGGECAGGFYDSPFDGLVGPLRLEDLWIRFRLGVPGNAAGAVFRRDALPELRRAAFAEIRERLDAGPGPWRARTDRFYRGERIRQWAGPVLTASSRWYRVVAPLLGEDYAAWALTIRARGGSGRAEQVAWIERLCPALARIPFASSGTRRRARGLRARLGSASARISKIANRLRGRRHAGDLGAPETAAALASDPALRAAMDRLGSAARLGLDEAGCADVLRDAAGRSHETGFLATAALAAVHVESVRARIAARVPASAGESRA